MKAAIQHWTQAEQNQIRASTATMLAIKPTSAIRV